MKTKLKNRFKNRYNWQITPSGHPYRMDYTARDFRAGIWARNARKEEKPLFEIFELFRDTINQLNALKIR